MMATKGRILHIGGWDAERDAPVGWAIDGADIGVQAFSDGRPTLVGGYTVEELREIHRSAEEVKATA